MGFDPQFYRRAEGKGKKGLERKKKKKEGGVQISAKENHFPLYGTQGGKERARGRKRITSSSKVRKGCCNIISLSTDQSSFWKERLTKKKKKKGKGLPLRGVVLESLSFLNFLSKRGKGVNEKKGLGFGRIGSVIFGGGG